jgi:hypothetical protein
MPFTSPYLLQIPTRVANFMRELSAYQPAIFGGAIISWFKKKSIKDVDIVVDGTNLQLLAVLKQLGMRCWIAMGRDDLVQGILPDPEGDIAVDIVCRPGFAIDPDNFTLGLHFNIAALLGRVVGKESTITVTSFSPEAIANLTQGRFKFIGKIEQRLVNDPMRLFCLCHYIYDKEFIWVDYRGKKIYIKNYIHKEQLFLKIKSVPGRLLAQIEKHWDSLPTFVKKEPELFIKILFSPDNQPKVNATFLSVAVGWMVAKCKELPNSMVIHMMERKGGISLTHRKYLFAALLVIINLLVEEGNIEGLKDFHSDKPFQAPVNQPILGKVCDALGIKNLMPNETFEINNVIIVLRQALSQDKENKLLLECSELIKQHHFKSKSGKALSATAPEFCPHGVTVPSTALLPVITDTDSAFGASPVVVISASPSSIGSASPTRLSPGSPSLYRPASTPSVPVASPRTTPTWVSKGISGSALFARVGSATNTLTVPEIFPTLKK